MGLRILVVDDEHLIVETLAEVLVWEGHQVTSASTGVAALERVHEEIPDLLLIDFLMPLMDGTTAIRHLRARPETAKLPVPSSVGEPILYDVLLVKPFKVAALRAAIE